MRPHTLRLPAAQVRACRFVARLLDADEIPSEHLPGSRHRVVRLADVLDFQSRPERRRAGRRQVADAVGSPDPSRGSDGVDSVARQRDRCSIVSREDAVNRSDGWDV